MPRISLENVTKKFKKVVALNNLSFEIEDGEFFVILGHGHDNRAHEQGCGQVVGNGRDQKGEQAGNPENNTQ